MCADKLDQVSIPIQIVKYVLNEPKRKKEKKDEIYIEIKIAEYIKMW